MFAHSRLLYHLLWIVPLAVGALVLARRRRRRILTDFYGGDQADETASGLSRRARGFRAVAALLAAVAIGLAIAGPRWGAEPKPERTIGCDVAILLDLSKSMLARDSKPDRLTLAKSLVDELVTQLPESRIGIIAFAGTAYTAVPFTSSSASVRMILEDLDPMSQPYGGSYLEDALTTLLERRSTIESTFAPVVILSDGEELKGSAQSLIPKLQDAGMTIYSVGIGDPSAKTRIQLPDDTFVTYDDKPVRTRLNPDALKALAEATGGRYLHADAEPLVTDKIASDIRTKMVAGLRSESGMRPTERFQWALAAALCLLLLRSAVSERRLATTAVVIACLCLPLNGANDAEPGAVTAAREAVDAAATPGEKARRSFALAMELQRAKAVDEAAAIYKELVLDTRTTTTLRSSALQNLGVLSHARGDAALTEDPETAIGAYAKAIRFYRAALALRHDTELVGNLQWAVARLASAETRLKELNERRERRQKAIRELIEARDHRVRANSQPTSDDDNEAALKMTALGGKTAKPLTIAKLDDTIASAVSLQRAFGDTSVLDERREFGKKAMDAIIEALRLLGVKDPKKRKKPPQNGNGDQPPKGTMETTSKNLPEALRILREMAQKERDDRREIMKESGPSERVGRRREKDW